MIQDLQFIILSYLSFEEILGILNDDTRDKFIKIHKPKIPSTRNAITNGDLETLKYLLTPEKFLEIIDKSIFYGHLHIIKHIYQNQKVEKNYTDIAIYYNRLEILKFLSEMGYKISLETIEDFDRLEIFKWYQQKFRINLKFSFIFAPRIYRYLNAKNGKKPQTPKILCRNRFQVLEEEEE